MKQRMFVLFLNFLSRITKKTIIYYNKNEHNGLGLTAVKSSYGFWYVGNVFDSADMAYSIANNGVVEKEETELVVRLLRNLMETKEEISFYDIGANTGYYGIFAAQLGQGRVRAYSFEPLAEHVTCLDESARLNRLENRVTSYTVALSDANGKEKIFTAGTGSSLEADFLDDVNTPSREIEMRRLDDLVKAEGLPAADFMKIDVEGHELKALKGATEIIKGSTPIAFIEIAYTLKSMGRAYVNEHYDETFRYFLDLGYSTFRVDGAEVLEYDHAKPVDGIQMYLFLHKEKHASQINLLLK